MEGKSPLSEDVKKQFTSNRSYDDHKEVEPPVRYDIMCFSIRD